MVEMKWHSTVRTRPTWSVVIQSRVGVAGVRHYLTRRKSDAESGERQPTLPAVL